MHSVWEKVEHSKDTVSVRKVLLGLVPLFHLPQLKVATRSVHLVQAPQFLAMQRTSYGVVALQCKPLQ